MVSRTFQTLHLRLDLIEKILYDGKLLWKIDNFKRRHHEAVIGIRRSNFSVLFYTSSQGYKMCASVFLNGNDEGRGTYLSFYIAIMEGPNDDRLPWPFLQVVSLLLINQETEYRNIVGTF